MKRARITGDSLPTATISIAPDSVATESARIAPVADVQTADAFPHTTASPAIAARSDVFASPIRLTDTCSGSGAEFAVGSGRSDPFAVQGTADSLHTPAAVVPVAYRDVAAERIFGSTSISVPSQYQSMTTTPSLTDNPVFQSFVLLLAAIYAILLSHNLGDVRQLLGRISRDTATGQRLFEDPGRSGFSRFLNVTTTIGMLFMGVMTVKYGDTLMPRRLMELIPHGAVLILSLLATAACTLLILFQSAAVHLAGAVTLSQGLVAQLQLLKRTYFSLAVVIASPALLLFALCPRGTGGIWFCIIAIELTVTAILYLKESLNLFLSKKISILHWFLYLCTVEIFPISLLCLLAARRHM